MKRKQKNKRRDENEKMEMWQDRNEKNNNVI